MAQTQSTTSKRSFKHLDPFQRGQIAALHREGKTQEAIANAIGCNRSTVCRELKRGTVTQMKTDRKTFEAYFPETAQAKYEENRKACGAKLKLDHAIEFIQFAEKRILEDHWSPDAVCGSATLNKQFSESMVCIKTLYNYSERGYIGVKNIDLPLKVRLNTKKRRIRVNKRVLGRSIEERPAAIDERTEFGHWEIDTVIGKKSQDEALMTLTERKTRQEIIMRIDGKDSESVPKALELLHKQYASKFDPAFKIITSDNGSEFAELVMSLAAEKTEIFFTHPYTSCERGTNERHNGPIRRFIPKGKAIRSVAEETIRYAENWCNRLPRKILGYRTPEACFLEELANIA